MKRVALYSPYFPKHAGGGERYLLSLAEVASWTCETVILVPLEMVEQAREALVRCGQLFGLSLQNVKVSATSIGLGRNPIRTLMETKTYDVLFAMTDGSIFPTFAAQSYLIVQVPWTRTLGPVERLKLLNWKNIIVYSDFVRDRLSNSWRTKKIEVLAPYVDTRDFSAVPVIKKEKLIVNVGRFFSHSQSNSKRQDVLVDAFKKMIDQYHYKGWQLVLLGNVDPNPDSLTYIKKLKESAKGYPVSVHTDISYDELRAYYARASIYWHAAGFGVNEQKNPENTEHFGITTLEAMASGCIPLVVPKGGQREVVNDPKLFWESEDQLVASTASLIASLHKDQQSWQQLSNDLIARSSRFSKSVFERRVHTLIE